MSVKYCDSAEEGLPQSYSYDVDSADDASVCSQDSGMCMSPGWAPNAKPELKYSYGPTWNQGHPSYMHNPLGAVPYSLPVNTRWAPQPAPIVCLPPTYNQSPHIKTEHKNYFNLVDIALNELRMADVQLQSEIRTGLNSQSATLSLSSSVVQKQLRQAQKYCKAIKKQLKTVESRCHDRQISVQEVKELRGRVKTVIKEQKSLRRGLKRERRKGARA
ncbi:uncharacterized protein FTJAE_5966 [Fusarium tjaetaba]|uniref:Uncharacterized protein n=1 Tax=Fusarium tjaetaba TaxID=1567544 RepID=A0A8H5VWB3_9HYPO|nr:uncharacterized protein FTJAE_5966 [Fusarium tjaetaba]KAF5636770.1 hypothetical protein FTJAE_5966 [Fusarium tjaetaba]